MSTKAPKQPISSHTMQQALESLRGHLIELEAVAHAAEDALQHLPFTPPPAAHEGAPPYTNEDLGMRRLHALVVATATAARIVLQEADRAVEDASSPKYLPVGPGHGKSRAGENWQPHLVRASSMPVPMATLQAAGVLDKRER